MTRPAPRTRASCTARCPTPLAAAVTSAASPRSGRAASRAPSATRPLRTRATASTAVAVSGTGEGHPCVQERVVGVPVPEAQPRHPVTDTEAAGSGAHGRDLAGDLAAQRHRFGGLGDLADDGERHADRLAADEQLSGSRPRDGASSRKRGPPVAP